MVGDLSFWGFLCFHRNAELAPVLFIVGTEEWLSRSNPNIPQVSSKLLRAWGTTHAFFLEEAQGMALSLVITSWAVLCVRKHIWSLSTCVEFLQFAQFISVNQSIKNFIVLSGKLPLSAPPQKTKIIFTMQFGWSGNRKARGGHLAESDDYLVRQTILWIRPQG